MSPVVPDGAAVFVGWPNWAQLAMVLGGLLAILVTVALGVKLWNGRKDAALENTPGPEQTETAHMVRASDEVPFGVRALMDAAEVEGVWHSASFATLPRRHLVQTDGRSAHQVDRRVETDLPSSRYHPVGEELASADMRQPSRLLNPASPSTGDPELPARRRRIVIGYRGSTARRDFADSPPGSVERNCL